MKTKSITLVAIGALALLSFAWISSGLESAEKVTAASSAPVGIQKEPAPTASSRKAPAPATATAKAATASSTDKAKQPTETEKRESSEQLQARAKVSDLTTTQKSKMLTLLNEGDLEQLAAIKGISETRAAAIEKARPYKSIDEVVLVRGIGEGTFAEVIAHARSLTARRSTATKTSES